MSTRLILNQNTHWVFDMDGTLTQAAHDFPAIRRALGIPQGGDILHHLDSLEASERAEKRQWLWQHEQQLALEATPARGAVELVRFLHDQGISLGVLTRNDCSLAWITLDAIGLADCFDKACVLGRDEALPKPDPEGLRRLANYWNVSTNALVMVGDSIHDMEAGTRADATTVLVNYLGEQPLPWPEKVSHQFEDCEQLMSSLRSR